MRPNRPRRLAALLCALLISWAPACRKSPRQTRKPAAQDGWYVLKGGREVLWVKKEPGPLMSAAESLRRPPVMHPFLTAKSFDLREESTIREKLEKSKSFDEFVALLKQGGYTLSPAQGTR